jgi:hypothetical protein
MGQRFVACDREQSFLMPPDVREWLPSRHLAWFVIDAVAEMDLEAFYAAYRVDGCSRPPYDPAMMVALLLYAYARGVRSSRVIERACEEDVAFRVLAAQQRPDHALPLTDRRFGDGTLSPSVHDEEGCSMSNPLRVQLSGPLLGLRGRLSRGAARARVSARDGGQAVAADGASEPLDGGAPS